MIADETLYLSAAPHQRQAAPRIRMFHGTQRIPASRTDHALVVNLPGLRFQSHVPLGLEFYLEEGASTFHRFYFMLELPKYSHFARDHMHNRSGLRK